MGRDQARVPPFQEETSLHEDLELPLDTDFNYRTLSWSAEKESPTRYEPPPPLASPEVPIHSTKGFQEAPLFLEGPQGIYLSPEADGRSF